MRFVLALLLALAGFVPSGLAESPQNGSAPVDFTVVRRVEREIDTRIERFSVESPMEVIGATRAVYLKGVGLIYSIEVSLAPAVGISPFFQKMSAADIDKIHQAKLQRVPVLRQLLLQLLPRVAAENPGLGDDEDIVLAATLFYFPYEKLDRLPRQILVRAKAGKLRSVTSASQESEAARVIAITDVKVY